MNFGKIICDLRKQKNMTQEELAAELGVTAAAVSKWEKGYSLPDLLMLCALADYFGVTADQLLGRSTEKKFAIVSASSRELGAKIQSLAEQHGIVVTGVFDSKDDAAAAIREDTQITHLILGLLGNQFPEISLDLGDRTISLYVSISDTEQGILNDLRNSLRSNA